MVTIRTAVSAISTVIYEYTIIVYMYSRNDGSNKVVSVSLCIVVVLSGHQ